MSQHEVINDKGRFVFGWDNPLQSFFLQLHVKDVEEDENPVVWLGATSDTSMYEVDELVHAAHLNGLEIGREMRSALYGDKDDGR